MARVVIHANIIVSAAFGGNPLKAVTLAMKDDEVFLSSSVEKELTNLAPKLSKKLTSEQISFFQERVRELIRMAKVVSAIPTVTLSQDPKDDHCLALCKAVEADCLITGDRDLLGIAPALLRETDICCQILTPQSYVEKRRA